MRNNTNLRKKIYYSLLRENIRYRIGLCFALTLYVVESWWLDAADKVVHDGSKSKKVKSIGHT